MCMQQYENFLEKKKTIDENDYVYLYIIADRKLRFDLLHFICVKINGKNIFLTL